MLSVVVTACASNVPSPSPSTSALATTSAFAPSKETSVPSLTPEARTAANSYHNIVASLKMQGVPVKSARFVGFAAVSPPIVAEFTVQLPSAGDTGTPESAGWVNLVEHEANLAQQRGLNIGGVGTILINSQGEVVQKGINRATGVDQLPTGLSSPFFLSDEAVSSLLKQKIHLSAPSTINITVFQDTDGLRQVSFDIQVPDLQAANSNIGIVSDIQLAIRCVIR